MIYDKTRVNEPGYYDQFELFYKPALEKDRKDAERYRWLRNSEWVPFNEEWIGVMGILDRQDLDRTIDAEMWLTTKPLLVAPPVTKGKAESQVPWLPDALCHACGIPGGYAFCTNPNCKNKPESHIDHPLRHFDRTCQACISQLNHVVDDYDLTSNDTRRGD